MKNGLIYLVLSVFLLVSCDEDKKNISQLIKNVPDHSIRQESDTYNMLKTQCYICHSINAVSHDALIAPPMAAVKKRYLRIYNTKEEFVNAFAKWALDPNKDDAIMRGAVSQFNVMPKQIFKEEDIRKIAAYIFENELERPEWFGEHEKEMHGGHGHGRGMKRKKWD